MQGRYLSGIILTATLLAGCDTEDELLKQRLEVARAEEASLQSLESQISSGKGFEGAGKVGLFVSKDTLNSILAGGDGVTVQVPGVAGATVTLQSMRTDFRLGFPSIRIEAVAQKAGLDAKLALVGAARLEPVIEQGSPAKLVLRIHVDSLVPRASWSIFDFAIGGFVRDLMQVKLTDEIRTAGVIRVPIEADLPLKLDAKQTAVSFPGVNAYVATPQLSLKARANITQVITMPDGLHVYGNISAGKEGI